MILVNVLLGFSQFFRAIPIMNPLPWFMIATSNSDLYLYMYFLAANIQYCYYQLTILAHFSFTLHQCGPSLIVILDHKASSCAVWSTVGPYQYPGEKELYPQNCCPDLSSHSSVAIHTVACIRARPGVLSFIRIFIALCLQHRSLFV